MEVYDQKDTLLGLYKNIWIFGQLQLGIFLILFAGWIQLRNPYHLLSKSRIKLQENVF